MPASSLSGDEEEQNLLPVSEFEFQDAPLPRQASRLLSSLLIYRLLVLLLSAATLALLLLALLRKHSPPAPTCPAPVEIPSHSFSFQSEHNGRMCENTGDGFNCLDTAFEPLLSSHHGMNYEADRLEPLNSTVRADRVFATMLLHNSAEDDWYFTSVRIQIYRLLHRKGIRAPYQFVVFCPKDLPKWKIERLEKDGATIRYVDILAIDTLTISRWRETFTKLQLFNQTEYDRIVYLDADLFVVQSLEALMQDRLPAIEPSPNSQGCNLTDSPSFNIAAVKDFKINIFNSGMLVIRPNQTQYNEMRRILAAQDFDIGYGDQALLNKYFALENTLCWTRLPRQFNVNWPRLEDMYAPLNDPHAGARVIHTKLWDDGSVAKELTRSFYRALGEMEGYYQGKEA